MKKLLVVTIVTAALIAGIGLRTNGYASDWDKAGKVLVATEGLRIITGGACDILGSITGVNRRTEARERGRDYDRDYARRDDHDRRYVRNDRRCASVRIERVWVPHYVLRDRWVPAHWEDRGGCRSVWISGHYEKYEVQEGGHWEETRICRK